jgi:predicted nucleotidyltransferase
VSRTTDDQIAAVVRVLERDPRIASAILFGSAGTTRERPGSDIDVALVAVDDEAARLLERHALRVGAECSLEAFRDVQIVVLESAPLPLAWQALSTGRYLFERDPRRRAVVVERILVAWVDAEVHRRWQWEAYLDRYGVPHGRP